MWEMSGLMTARQICSEWGQEKRPYIIGMLADYELGDLHYEKFLAAIDDHILIPLRDKQVLVTALRKCFSSDGVTRTSISNNGSNDLQTKTSQPANKVLPLVCSLDHILKPLDNRSEYVLSIVLIILLSLTLTTVKY